MSTTPDTPERAALVAAKEKAYSIWLEVHAALARVESALAEYDRTHPRPDRRSGRDRRTEAK